MLTTTFSILSTTEPECRQETQLHELEKLCYCYASGTKACGEKKENTGIDKTKRSYLCC